jgi:hypothetical protein
MLVDLPVERGLLLVRVSVPVVVAPLTLRLLSPLGMLLEPRMTEPALAPAPRTAREPGRCTAPGLEQAEVAPARPWPQMPLHLHRHR